MTPHADTSTHHVALGHDLDYRVCGSCNTPYLLSQGHECVR